MAERLTESRIGEIWHAMPGGDKGFMVDWGYMQFARAVETAVRGPDQDEEGRKATVAELEWAIANNADRPRTQMALQWALDALNEIEEVEVKG
jgi:hypothetical protein